MKFVAGKKLFAILFAAAGISVKTFAVELLLTPTLGYSHIGFTGVSAYGRTDINRLKTTIGTNVMPLGFALELITDSGFTVILNNDIAPLGEGTLRTTGVTLDTKLEKGVSAQRSIVFARTFKVRGETIYINIGAGAAAGITKLTLHGKSGDTDYNKSDIWDFSIGVPLQVGIHYFFTKFAGINLTFLETVGISFGFFHDDKSAGHLGFENIFTIKAGPIFKF